MTKVIFHTFVSVAKKEKKKKKKKKKPENDMIRQVSIVSNFINENHFKKYHKTSETS